MVDSSVILAFWITTFLMVFFVLPALVLGSRDRRTGDGRLENFLKQIVRRAPDGGKALS
jgi:hypothetical protein